VTLGKNRFKNTAHQLINIFEIQNYRDFRFKLVLGQFGVFDDVDAAGRQDIDTLLVDVVTDQHRLQLKIHRCRLRRPSNSTARLQIH